MVEGLSSADDDDDVDVGVGVDDADAETLLLLLHGLTVEPRVAVEVVHRGENAVVVDMVVVVVDDDLFGVRILVGCRFFHIQLNRISVMLVEDDAIQDVARRIVHLVGKIEAVRI